MINTAFMYNSIEETIRNPDYILKHYNDSSMNFYLKKIEDLYLLVAVKFSSDKTGEVVNFNSLNEFEYNDRIEEYSIIYQK